MTITGFFYGVCGRSGQHWQGITKAMFPIKEVPYVIREHVLRASRTKVLQDDDSHIITGKIIYTLQLRALTSERKDYIVKEWSAVELGANEILASDEELVKVINNEIAFMDDLGMVDWDHTITRDHDKLLKEARAYDVNQLNWAPDNYQL